MLVGSNFWNADDIFTVSEETNHEIEFKIINGIFIKTGKINKSEEGKSFKFLFRGKTNYYKDS
jgi:hypothetical protein